LRSLVALSCVAGTEIIRRWQTNGRTLLCA
jgi:hypothetical protein